MMKKLLQSKFKILTLVFVLVLSILRLSNEEEVSYPHGDAVEYMIMTEAIYNHGSVDLRKSDVESFKELFIRSNPWEKNQRAGFYDEIANWLGNEQLKFMDYNIGFFVSNDGRKYSCHFFFYSFLNLPVRWICEWIPFNPLKIHQITNIILLIITCFLLYKYSTFSQLETTAFVWLFFYSTNYWYLPWQHTEILTSCLTSLGIWLFIGKRYYVGLLLVSIAALQNQPLSLLAALLALTTIYLNGINKKNILLVGLSSFWVLLPSFFYYSHFGTFNLVAAVGSIKTEFVTFNRVFGFFFDINQGVILALPFVLLLYIFLIIRKTIVMKNEQNKWEILIPFALIAVVCSAASIDNWNHGQAVVNRYVTYVGAVILVHCVILVLQLKNPIVKWSLLLLSLATQIKTIYYHQALTKWDWSGCDPKPISNWLMENHPEYYNPDPTIFYTRYGNRPFFDIKIAPAYYMKGDGEITKMLVNKNHLNTLLELGYSEEQIADINSNVSFVNDWAYIDIINKYKSAFSREKIKSVDSHRRMIQQVTRIKNETAWYESLKKNAKLNGNDEDTELRLAAAYVLNIDIRDVENREEKIQRKIKEIKEDRGWYNYIKKNAEKDNLPLDSAILINAIFVAEQEIKKTEELR